MENKKLLSLFVFLIVSSVFTCSVNAGSGGASVPIKTEELNLQGKDYTLTPTRLKFDFDGDLYAVQLRRVKQYQADFIIMTLDKNKPNDIMAYTVDNSFTLKPGEKKEIDLDGDNSNDLLVKLNNIGLNSFQSAKSASFFIQKISSVTQPVVTGNPIKIQENTEDSGEQLLPSMDEVVVIQNNNLINSGRLSFMEESTSKTIFEKIIGFFKTLF